MRAPGVVVGVAWHVVVFSIHSLFIDTSHLWVPSGPKDKRGMFKNSTSTLQL